MPAPQTQSWSVDELGRWGAAPEVLSKKVRHEAQATMLLAQFALHEEDFGKKKGDTLTFNIYSDIGNTDRRILQEHEPIPIGSIHICQVKLVVTEYGFGLPYTGKAEKLSEISIKDQCVQALRRDYKKSVDTEVYLEMVKCGDKYVPTGAAAGTMYTDGTAGVAAASNLNAYHVKRMVDYLEENSCPKAKGGYWGVLSVRAARGIKDSLETIKMYTSFNDMARGECGKYESVRFVVENHALQKSQGTAGVAGEAFIFGKDIVMRGRVLPMQLRSKTGDDFGRNPAMAWYDIEGFKEVHEKDADIRQYHMVHFASA